MRRKKEREGEREKELIHHSERRHVLMLPVAVAAQTIHCGVRLRLNIGLHKSQPYETLHRTYLGHILH